MNSKVILSVLCGLLVWPALGRAQLVATLSPVKAEGNKAVLMLSFKNDLTNAVESARASVFLVDDGKKAVGQATRWVIGGGGDKPGLAPGATNTFYFVITSDKPFGGANLTAKVNFDRIVLEGGKLGDVRKDVKVEGAGN